MSGLFTDICLHCNCCGIPILTQFSRFDGRFCDNICRQEYDLRRAVCIIGESGQHPQAKVPFVRKENPTTQAKEYLVDFFTLLGKIEENYNGLPFFPNYISSYRALDIQKFTDIINFLREWSGYNNNNNKNSTAPTDK